MRLSSGLLVLLLAVICYPQAAFPADPTSGDETEVAAPDSTGLVGTPYKYDSRGDSTLNSGSRALPPPYKLWMNTRESALKPRRRDRNPHELMAIIGDDFDPRWMRRTKREDKMLNATSWVETRAVDMEEGRRPSVVALWKAALALQPPTTWPSPPSETVLGGAAAALQAQERHGGSPAAWLVALGTCPVRSEWRDLGRYFWPRFVRSIECQPLPRQGVEVRGHRRTKAQVIPFSCGWPPGRLTCGTGVVKDLHILRWHCRLRSSMEAFARLAPMLAPGKAGAAAAAAAVTKRPQRKRRKRYQCEWIKVPFHVSADCQCGGFQ